MKCKKTNRCTCILNDAEDLIDVLHFFLSDEPEEKKPEKKEEKKAEVQAEKCACKSERPADLALSSPWVQYANALRAFFGEDPDIDFEFDEDENKVTMRVGNQEKADALMELLPAEKEFGNVKLTIDIVPADGESRSDAELVAAALYGNPILSFIRTVDGVMSNRLTYVVFAKKVVQYFNDNLGDIFGNRNTLYQDLAKEIFGDLEGVYFGTDID